MFLEAVMFGQFMLKKIPVNAWGILSKDSRRINKNPFSISNLVNFIYVVTLRSISPEHY